MSSRVETFTPVNTPHPIGPYNHIAKVGQFITISATAGIKPETGDLVEGVYSQTKQILETFGVMLKYVGSNLNHVLHVNVFLKDIEDFETMNRGYVEMMGENLPARTVIAVKDLPKPGALVTMNLTAVTKEKI